MTFSRQSIFEVWGFSKGIIGIGFVALLLAQVDKPILSRLLSLEAFGCYSLAVSIVGLTYVMVGSVTTAFFAILVQLSNQGKSELLAGTYHLGARLITTLTTPFAILLSMFPAGVVFAWTGDVRLAQEIAPPLRCWQLVIS